MNHARSFAYFAGALTLLIPLAHEAPADSGALETEVRRRCGAIEEKLIAWRRDIHQHPELGDQEKRTSGLVADHLRTLGMDVRTNVARTGVIGILKGER